MKKGRGTTARMISTSDSAMSTSTGPYRLASGVCSSMEPETASTSSSTVLVIDDDADVRSAAKRVLSRHGFTVLIAANGAAGAELLRGDTGIGVVLLDLNMPGLDGVETARELRGIRPGITLIVMSGEVEREVSDRLQGIDFAGFVAKPFIIDELLAAVRGLRGG